MNFGIPLTLHVLIGRTEEGRVVGKKFSFEIVKFLLRVDGMDVWGDCNEDVSGTKSTVVI